MFVCVSVTFVDCVKTNKYIFKIVSPSGRSAILVFPYQTVSVWQYSDGNHPNGGVKRRWGRQKSRFWANIWLHSVLWSVPAASAIHLSATDRGEFITLVAGGVCWWRKTTTKCMTRNLNVTPKTTLCSGEIWSLRNNNNTLHSYIVEDNYWRTQSIARPLCNSRATCSSYPTCIPRPFYNVWYGKTRMEKRSQPPDIAHRS